MTDKHKKLFILLIIVFISVIEILIFRNYLSHSFIFADDTDCSWLHHGLDIIFKNPGNGAYIPSTLDRIFAANIPFILNMHPSAFKSIYFSIIESILLILFIFNFHFLINKKLNYCSPLIFIFASSIFIYITQIQPYTLFVYDGFFRMILPAFIFILLFYLLLKDKKNIVISYIILPTLTFLCAISNELLCVMCLIGLFLFSLISIFKKYEKWYLCIIYLLFSILGCLVLIKTGMFTRKSSGTNFDLQFFTSITKQIPDFILPYIKCVFINHIFGYILFISQIIFLKYKLPSDIYKNKVITLNLCFITGILCFFFSLIVLGKTHYNPGDYWVVHEDLHMIYSFVLTAINFALINIILEHELLKKYILYSLLIVSSVFLIFKNFMFYSDFVKNQIDTLRLETYKGEKIIRLANLQDKTAYLNKDYFENGYLWGFFYTVNDKEINKLYNFSPYVEYLNQFNNSKIINNGWIFTDEEKVNAAFEENGGTFSEYELNNTNFNKLLDEKFLLNK